MRSTGFGRPGAWLAVSLLAFSAGVACFLLWQYGRPPHTSKAAERLPAAQTPAAVPGPAGRHPRGPIGDVDFYNFTYHSPSAGKRVTVRDGELEYPTEPGCGQTFSVQKVSYIDFTGDGEDEALVRFIDHAACGSSCASVNYFVYTVRRGRPFLLWSVATGCEAYGGEKDFRVEGTEMVLELYGKWVASGDGIRLTREKGLPYHCDRCTNHYAVYRVAWDGKRFRRKSLEEVTCPEGCFR
jgi:hypothetical protein